MTAFNNDSLKLANLQAVFRAAVDEGCETRSEIAGATGLSIVTVGKAVEVFLDLGILVQRTLHKKSLGRQAGRVGINPDRRFAVIDISSRNFAAAFFDLSLSLTGGEEYEYIADYSYGENLCVFLHRVKARMLNERLMRYSAISMVVPGVYTNAADSVVRSGDGELEKLKIRDFAKSMAAMPVDLVLDRVSAAARYCALSSRGEPNILYINTDGGLEARLIVRGKLFRRHSPSGPIAEGRCGLVIQICDMIACVSNITGLEEVVIESEELGKSCDALERLNVTLSEALPGYRPAPGLLLNPPVKYSLLGSALTSRNLWFDRTMK